MDLTSIVIMLCIGNAAGWIAGIYFEGGRFGLLGDVTAATAGAMLAGYLYRLPVPVAGAVGLLICGVTGAVAGDDAPAPLHQDRLNRRRRRCRYALA